MSLLLITSVYLELSKAFGTIDHTILIDKLKYYGVHGIHLKLFISYLENRRQYKEIDNIKSNMSSITQGSILGLLLFIIIYIYISMILLKQLKCLTL